MLVFFFFLDDGKINVCVLDKSSSLQDLAFCFGDVSAIIQITVYFFFFFLILMELYTLVLRFPKQPRFQLSILGALLCFLH